MNIPQPGAPQAAIVPIVSAWASKINWAAIISFLATIVALWNVTISAEMQVQLVAGLMAFCALVDVFIFLFRTWFTKSVTAASVSAAPVVQHTVPTAVPDQAFGIMGMTAEPQHAKVAVVVTAEEVRRAIDGR